MVYSLKPSLEVKFSKIQISTKQYVTVTLLKIKFKLGEAQWKLPNSTQWYHLLFKIKKNKGLEHYENFIVLSKYQARFLE